MSENTPEQIEAVARALCVAIGRDPDADWRMQQTSSRGGFMLSVAVDPENTPWWTCYRSQAAKALDDARAQWSAFGPPPN
jgi:hypothetical protein